MSKVIEKAKLHFEPLRKNLQKIHIPEWGDGGDADYFYFTAITLKERQVIEKYAKDETELAVEIIIKKLKDANDNPVYDRTNKQDLMTKVCPRVIGRVAKEILGDIDLEELEKNS